MNEDLDKVITSIEQLETKNSYNEKNRSQLLVIHAFIGMGVGVCILWLGGPESFSGLVTEPHTKFLLGAVPLVGGAILFLGLVLGRKLVLESLGMTLLLIWDLWMGYGFIWALANVGGANPYPLVIYGGFAAFMCVHLGTLYKFIDGKTSGR